MGRQQKLKAERRMQRKHDQVVKQRKTTRWYAAII